MQIYRCYSPAHTNTYSHVDETRARIWRWIRISHWFRVSYMSWGCTVRMSYCISRCRTSRCTTGCIRVYILFASQVGKYKYTGVRWWHTRYSYAFYAVDLLCIRLHLCVFCVWFNFFFARVDLESMHIFVVLVFKLLVGQIAIHRFKIFAGTKRTRRTENV